MSFHSSISRFLWVLACSGTAYLSAQKSFAQQNQFTPSLAYDWRTHVSADPETVVNVLDPEVLRALEAKGFSLGELLSGAKSESRADELYESNALYRSFADVIAQPIDHDAKTDQLPNVIPSGKGDIPEMVRLIRNFEDKGKRSDKDLKGGYYIRHLSNNSQYPYSIEYDGDEPRHFDPRWLQSKFASYKLIAVINRMDRVDFSPITCGEIRFIFRLSYQSPKSSSSLPFFINVVERYPKEKSCAPFAKQWLITQNQSQTLRQAGAGAAGKFAEILLRGPLKKLSLKQIESNFQSLRFTSGYMHDFGGQAMYMLRIFRPSQGKLLPVSLENTPDVLAIEKEPALLERFVAFLKQGDHLEQLDQGTLLIDFDDKFLARLAVSWSTLGRARTANKPYLRLFRDKTALLKTIDLSSLKHIKTHDALVERLNNLTCMGCHQSGGTAGFHMLGFADDQFSHSFNRQELPVSPHSYAESFRRKAYVASVAKEVQPNRFRPHSNFPEANWSGGFGVPIFSPAAVGQMCVLEQSWFSQAPSCATGLECRKTVDTIGLRVPFGECVKASRPTAGAACWQGDLVEKQSLPTDRGAIPSYNFFAFQDKWLLAGSVTRNPDYKCVLPQSGAPLGRSSRACTVAEENFTNVKLEKNRIPDELCANQGGNGFDLCAASGDAGTCLEARVVRSMLDTCYPGKFCREDYICQKFPDYSQISEVHYSSKKNGKRVNQSTPKQIKGETIRLAQTNHIGFCVPTYFLFNMRADGHPSPVTGLPPGEPKYDRSQPVRGYPK